MKLSNIQRESISKIKQGLEELLQDQFFTLYGNNGNEIKTELKQYCKNYIDRYFDTIVEPDKTDLHRFNHRIQLLELRIKELESNLPNGKDN